MKNGIVSLFLICTLLFTGCSAFDGQYVRVTPHQMQSSNAVEEAYNAAKYSEIRDALVDMVCFGKEKGVIYTSGYDYERLGRAMGIAERFIRSDDPLGAYSIAEINTQVGNNSGRVAAAVEIKYRHSYAQMQRIAQAADISDAEEKILNTLSACDANAVLMIQNYENTDFAQMVRDISERNPQVVMEIPQVREEVYGRGAKRIVELTYTYENSRDSLRQMQTQVRPIFDAAAMYVSGEGSDKQKLSQLYAFLMERFDYNQDTSITPAYSLLRHGVGDSRAFANVYAAMCRKAGLECITVTGTRWGESWTWNIVCDEGSYYHVDLLRCSSEGGFHEFLDNSMTGYVWDYSAYPVCSANTTNVEYQADSDLQK